MTDSIEDYIKEGLNRGYSLTFLKKKLWEFGFSEEQVNDALRRVEIPKSLFPIKLFKSIFLPPMFFEEMNLEESERTFRYFLFLKFLVFLFISIFFAIFFYLKKDSFLNFFSIFFSFFNISKNIVENTSLSFLLCYLSLFMVIFVIIQGVFLLLYGVIYLYSYLINIGIYNRNIYKSVIYGFSPLVISFSALIIMFFYLVSKEIIFVTAIISVIWSLSLFTFYLIKSATNKSNAIIAIFLFVVTISILFLGLFFAYKQIPSDMFAEKSRDLTNYSMLSIPKTDFYYYEEIINQSNESNLIETTEEEISEEGTYEEEMDSGANLEELEEE